MSVERIGSVAKATQGQALLKGLSRPENVVAGLAFVAVIVAYVPTFLRLYDGPWQTEQEGHGPLILAAAGWLAWRQWDAAVRAEIRPAYFAGWTILFLSLALLVVTRSQDLLVIEAATLIPVLLGVVLLTFGWGVARAMAVPLAFMIFFVPPPGWALDIVTVPLKGMVSDIVAYCLYELGYPIAQNGVVIMVGAYELMVKDACSGMNSIFALSAIGVFYILEFVNNAPIRTALLIISIIPITLLANLLRVTALVLLTYYLGADAVEGLLHDLTGIFLFIAAIVLFFAFDGVMLAATALAKVSFGRR